MGWIRASLRIPFVILHLTVSLIPALIVIDLAQRRGWARVEGTMIRWWSRGAVRVFGVRVEQVGQPLHAPSLWVANHLSWLDIEVLHTIRPLAFIAKAEIERWPLFGFMAKRGGTIFHQRGSPNSLHRVARELTRVMAAGRSGAVFPEGKVGPGDRVLHFHARLFQTAMDAEVPVQPVTIDYRTRDGRHAALPFRPNESFVPNIMRLLTLPTCTARLTFGQPLNSQTRSRKELARAAQAEVTRYWTDDAV